MSAQHQQTGHRAYFERREEGNLKFIIVWEKKKIIKHLCFDFGKGNLCLPGKWISETEMHDYLHICLKLGKI